MKRLFPLDWYRIRSQKHTRCVFPSIALCAWRAAVPAAQPPPGQAGASSHINAAAGAEPARSDAFAGPWLSGGAQIVCDTQLHSAGPVQVREMPVPLLGLLTSNAVSDYFLLCASLWPHKEPRTRRGFSPVLASVQTLCCSVLIQIKTLCGVRHTVMSDVIAPPKCIAACDSVFSWSDNCCQGPGKLRRVSYDTSMSLCYQDQRALCPSPCS